MEYFSKVRRVRGVTGAGELWSVIGSINIISEIYGVRTPWQHSPPDDADLTTVASPSQNNNYCWDIPTPPSLLILIRVLRINQNFLHQIEW